MSIGARDETSNMGRPDVSGYANAAAVVPDVVVVTADGARMHRPAHTDETHPWCRSNEWASWTPVKRDRVAGKSLCDDCFAAALAAAAADPNSPVRYAGPRPTRDARPVANAPSGIEEDSRAMRDTSLLPLASVTRKVVVPRGDGRQSCHAPDADEQPACGHTGADEWRVVRRRAVHTYPLCDECFDVDAVADPDGSVTVA